MNRKLIEIAMDLGFLVGAAIFVYGLHCAWPPLAPLLGGPLLSAICYFCAYVSGRHRWYGQ